MFRHFIIREINHETSDTISLRLEPEEPGFRFQAGQFLTVVHNEARRSYSFSSHPTDVLPRITVKRIPNGIVSRWLFDQARVGDRLTAVPPAGFFTFPEDTTPFDRYVFLAAGSGIAPVLSLLREALSRADGKPILLLYSNRSRHQTIFLREIEELQQGHPDRLKVQFFFSDDQNLQRARMSRLALEQVLKHHEMDPERTLFFMCGPHVYMQNIAITLLTEGVPEENIRREIFFNPLPPAVEKPSDTEPHQVRIQFEGKSFNLKVQYPKSILQTAKEQGILLPYSCEAGRCGTCAATCTRGTVWMSRNEVLLDREMAQGRVLTCTGFAVGGDADIEFRSLD